MFNITKQQLDYDKVNEYIAACPGYEHTKLVTTNDLLFDKDLYTYRYGERPNDGPMGFPVASYRDAEGHLCVTQTCYNHHTLTIATTGRGKTQGSVLNIAYNADKRCSYIFTDPKNEVCKMSYNFLKELYGEENIDIINFLDPKHSTAFFNPFTDLAYEWINAENMPNKEEIRSNIEGEIEKICEILYPINNSKDESWDMTGRSLVQAIFQGCFEDLNLDPITCAKTGRSRVEPEMINFKTVERIFHSITYDRLGVHDNGFFSSRDVTSKAYTMTYSILHNADGTRANYFGFADLYIKRYSNPKIQEVTKYNTIKAEDFVKSPRVLFIIFNITDEKIREFVNICTARLASGMLELSHKNGKYIALETPIHFVIDEFACLRPCEVYKELLTVGRGSNIHMHLYIQSYQQLAEKYPEAHSTMRENTDLQIFLGTNGDETAEAFAKGLGKCAKADPAAFIMGTINVIQVPVATQDELLHRMKRGDSYIKRNGAMPLKVSYSLYYQTDEYKQYGLADTSKFMAKRHIRPEKEYILPHEIDDEEDDDDLDFLLKDKPLNPNIHETLESEDDEFEDIDEEDEGEDDFNSSNKYASSKEYVGIPTEIKINIKADKIAMALGDRLKYYKTEDEFEEKCMDDVIEPIVGLDPNQDRAEAIAISKAVLERFRNKKASQKEIRVLERVVHEFEIAKDSEYNLLRKQIFED